MLKPRPTVDTAKIQEAIEKYKEIKAEQENKKEAEQNAAKEAYNKRA